MRCFICWCTTAGKSETPVNHLFSGCLRVYLMMAWSYSQRFLMSLDKCWHSNRSVCWAQRSDDVIDEAAHFLGSGARRSGCKSSQRLSHEISIFLTYHCSGEFIACSGAKGGRGRWVGWGWKGAPATKTHIVGIRPQMSTVNKKTIRD